MSWARGGGVGEAAGASGIRKHNSHVFRVCLAREPDPSFPHVFRAPAARLFRTDERARAAYAEAAGIYRIVPRAVALPADLDDLVKLVRWAADERVRSCRAAPAAPWVAAMSGDGVVVDLTGDGRTRASRSGASERRARMRAGASLGELDAAAAPLRLRLPPDPSSWRWATAGGVMSTNAAGARSVRYGSVRRWVERRHPRHRRRRRR